MLHEVISIYCYSYLVYPTKPIINFLFLVVIFVVYSMEGIIDITFLTTITIVTVKIIVVILKAIAVVNDAAIKEIITIEFN